MERKNITLISLNYAPEDSAIGLYSTQWAEFLSKQGYNISVLTAFPYYPQWRINNDYRQKSTFLKEEENGIKIYRYKQYVPSKPTFFKRVVHMLDFTFGTFINSYKIKKSDLVIAVVPFTTSTLIGYILKKRLKAKLWIHIQDFEFDAAIQTGLGNKKSILFSFLFRIEKWLFSKADIASTISKSMIKKLSNKTSSDKFYFPNWIDENFVNPKRSNTHKYLSSQKIKLLYSGNIGDKQDWSTFVKFCNELNPDIYDIIIVGDGSMKKWLQEELRDNNNVTIHPPVPYQELSDLLCSCDAHLLFLKQDVIDTVMPSKVLGMMASEKPSIVIGHGKSEVKSIIDESKGGLYFTEYSDAIIEMVNDLFQNENDYLNMGKNARAYILDHFSKEQIMSSFIEKLSEI
ncbi:WcaI family glycosyltransferase [Winogradskyella sp. 3972H.M.0a.05]|uniref:glycosyltransferase family 4 protein n=1 Tax=Winogradskyella sp. 3972H.M.0a.05 TaxID=2950277 RepID=UPI0033954E11